jgi:hypothetical protein
VMLGRAVANSSSHTSSSSSSSSSTSEGNHRGRQRAARSADDASCVWTCALGQYCFLLVAGGALIHQLVTIRLQPAF